MARSRHAVRAHRAQTGLTAARENGSARPGHERGSHLSSIAMLRVPKRLGRNAITVHGFRSTFRDWCAECTNYPSDGAEMALAHALKDETEAATYRRGDLFEKRARLMFEWARYCDKAAEVIALSQGAS